MALRIAMARAARAMEVQVTDMAQAVRAMVNLHRAMATRATAILLIAIRPTATLPLAIATVLQPSTLMAMDMVRASERTPTSLMATRTTALAIPQAATAIQNTRMPKLPTLMSLATVSASASTVTQATTCTMVLTAHQVAREAQDTRTVMATGTALDSMSTLTETPTAMAIAQEPPLRLRCSSTPRHLSLW